MRAKLLKDVQRDGIRRTRKLYLLDTPYEYRDTSDPLSPKYAETYYLLASASIKGTEAEVTLLPADERGTPLSTTPLSGSLKGTYEHVEAVRKLGYDVVPNTILFPVEGGATPLTLVPPDFTACVPYGDNYTLIQFKDVFNNRYTIPGVAHRDGYVTIFSREYRNTGSLSISWKGQMPDSIVQPTIPPKQLPIQVPQTPPEITCNDP